MSAQIIFGMPWAEYIQGGYIGSSGLSEWGAVGREAWSRENLEEGYTDSKSSKFMAGGSVIDQRLMGDPHGKPVAVKPDGMSFATKEGKAWRDAHLDHEIITAEQDAEIQAALPLAREAIGILESVSGCKAQFQVTLRGEVSGVKIQTRPDMMIGNTLPDLKYVNGMDFGAFDRKYIDSRYFLQAGLAFGLGREAGISGVEASFLLVESGARLPRVSIINVPSNVLQAGWDKVRRICDEIAEVRDSALGFRDIIEVRELSLPAWAEARL